MSRFHIASDKEIMDGKTTDVYFMNTMKILKEKNVGEEDVTAEFTASSLPENWDWGIFCGLDEVLELMKGKNIDIYALPEGTLFRPKGINGILTPVMFIEGAYTEFCIFETPILGMICLSSGIASKSAKVKKAAQDTTVMSFGIRRMHPGLAPVIDRAAYIGGCDSISCITSAGRLGLEPQGTMPHALTIVFEDPKKAFKAFDEVLDEDVHRIALVDTYYDETTESFMASEAMGDDLYGVRLDTPSSRRGDFVRIVQEVKWELENRGIEANIITSGGMDEHSIPELREAGVEGFGVGTCISNARTVNYAMDIVEREGEPAAKRGKFSFKKQAYRCPRCFNYRMQRWDEEEEPTCPCGATMEPMLEKVMEDGKAIQPYPDEKSIKSNVTKQLERAEIDWKEG